jgi:hypothetical protein
VILIDFSGMLHSNTHALGDCMHNGVDTPAIDLLRHSMLSSILNIKRKFGKTYGDIVIACDGRDYWRKSVFPNYKVHRAAKRAESNVNWQAVLSAGDTIKSDLKTVFGYCVVEVHTAEADDIIGALVKHLQTNDLQTEGLCFGEPQEILIVSKDHDFLQLQKFGNVTQYNTTSKKIIRVSVQDALDALNEHIIRGDAGDGVPNMLSADDSIVRGIKQTPITSGRLDRLKDVDALTYNEMRNYTRNRQLVDLDYIPESLVADILACYNDAKCVTISRRSAGIFDYFVKNRLIKLMDNIKEF